jgi:hypothetical protein
MHFLPLYLLIQEIFPDMKRRSAVKNLTMLLAGLGTMPAWVSCWTPDSSRQMVSLSATDESLLAEIMETIVPETDTPGSKSLQIHQFALRMIHDCYDESILESVINGLAQTEKTAQNEFGASFTACEPKQRVQVLANLSQSAEPEIKEFVALLKGLTIRGYQNSEYVMVNLLGYTMAPGFYHGCVPQSA